MSGDYRTARFAVIPDFRGYPQRERGPSTSMLHSHSRTAPLVARHDSATTRPAAATSRFALRCLLASLRRTCFEATLKPKVPNRGAASSASD
jgi:hypothetical protein